MNSQYLILERQYMNLQKKYAKAHEFIDSVAYGSIDFVYMEKARAILQELKDID